MKRTKTGISTTAVVVALIIVAIIVVIIWLPLAPDDLSRRTEPAQPAQPAPPPPVTGLGRVNDERVKRAATDDPGQWLTYGQTFEEQRFSTLTQINRETVRRLGLAFAIDLGTRYAHEA